MLRSRRLLKDSAFALVAGGTTNVLVEKIDLSGAEALVLFLSLTTALTDATDTLDVRLQETRDKGVTWNTRAHLAQFLGNMTVSATAPETYEVQILARPTIDQPGSAYEPSGSAGATDLVAGSVRHGPFTGQYRGTTGWVSALRLQFVVVDAGVANVNFAGTVSIWAQTAY